jgi:hypothetical protein
MKTARIVITNNHAFKRREHRLGFLFGACLRASDRNLPNPESDAVM